MSIVSNKANAFTFNGMDLIEGACTVIYDEKS